MLYFILAVLFMDYEALDRAEMVRAVRKAQRESRGCGSYDR